MSKRSIIDEPIGPKWKDGEKTVGGNASDRLGTAAYAKTLANYIINCDTPMTIGIQGEWGSGKTSLLNMIREEIEEVELGRGRGKWFGRDEYKSIWVNTWEHSLMKSPEECLLSIIEEIIEEISATDGSYQNAERAKRALSGLAQSALKITAGVAFGATGAQVAGEMLASGGSNKVKQLRSSLDSIVSQIVGGENRVKRFVVFIDDLDRLDPSVAVQVLELLKNIFTIPHCVFILAIDYQVVVKGLKGKFGEPNEKNEWEFRAFFDKIIQLPFMMPMATYDLQNYILNNLEDIDYLTRSEINNIKDDKRLARIVSCSLGFNPRSIKRLINALSLIKSHNWHGKNEDAQVSMQIKQLVFALVCLQISFPRVFELLLFRPDFIDWDDEFVEKMTSGGVNGDEVDDALNNVMRINPQFFGDDSRDEWKQALFRIIWLKGWEKSQVLKVVKLLSEISDKILFGRVETDFVSDMRKGLTMTAVTTVTATDQGFFSDYASDEGVSDAQINSIFWQRFSKAMSGTGCVFDPEINPIRATHSTSSLKRRSGNSLLEVFQFVMTQNCRRPLRIYSDENSGSDSVRFFELIKENKSEIEEFAKCKLILRGGKNRRQAIFFEPDFPELTDGSSVGGSLATTENDKLSERVFAWIRDAQPKIEAFLIELSSSIVHSDTSALNDDGIPDN